jgi:hypothetical protein
MVELDSSRNGPASDAPSKPVLASEALMDDVAPVEPAKRAAQAACVAFGVTAFASAALAEAGLRAAHRLDSVASVVLGVVGLVAALSRAPYRQRAVSMLVLGTLSAVLGLADLGPTPGLSAPSALTGALRLLAGVAVAGALLFRSHYRAFGGARWALALSLGLAAPFVVQRVLHLSSASGVGWLEAADALALVALLASFGGFMGSESTGAGSIIGPLLLTALGFELGAFELRASQALEGALAKALLGSVAYVAAAGLVALGVFQLLAARFTQDARRIDVRKTIEPPPQPPESRPASDWP